LKLIVNVEVIIKVIINIRIFLKQKLSNLKPNS